MMMLNTARDLALATLARLTGRPLEDLLLVDELTQCRRVGWIFFYESRAYLESGDATQAIGGTGPVVVTPAGAVHPLDGDRGLDEALRELEPPPRRRA